MTFKPETKFVKVVRLKHFQGDLPKYQSEGAAGLDLQWFNPGIPRVTIPPGERFLAHLSITYGTEKGVNWFKTVRGEAYTGFESKFEDVFNTDFTTAWADFITNEIKFRF